MNIRLEYGKVKLRAIEPDDLETLYRWENAPEIWPVSDTHAPWSRHVLQQYIENSHRDIYELRQLRLMLCNMEDRPVGAIDLFDFEPYHLRAGVGILVFEPSDRRHGLAFEALLLLCTYAYNSLGLHQLYANIGADNAASIALFEKAGFSCCGEKREWRRTPDGWQNELLYQRILTPQSGCLSVSAGRNFG
ncbi:MAG: GNAT family N-acetyltransferase [Bacteroidales bacterium]|jgi:diamine N-acetyltransferase|nr:GNAT family N-acetyltransferase [Bacteroidales bacterium]